MAKLTSLLVPLLLLFASMRALRKQEDAFSALCCGAKGGLKTVAAMLPPLVVLLTAVSLLRASGAMEWIARLLGPAASTLGIPTETLPLLLVRPLSGSAALALGAELMAQYGPDSLVGRTAAVILGSTETTFYVVSVYFGSVGVRKTRYAIPAALLADLTGFVTATLFTRLFL